MSQPDRRRSGTRPGRRLSFGVAATLAALAVTAPSAGADQPVVSATVYPGAQVSVSTRAVLLSQLQACSLYTGPSPMYLYPGDQPYQTPGDSTWTLTEVLQCGLGIPQEQLSDVEVQTSNRGYEAPLTSAGLTDPGQYHDPAAPGALPIISSDGTENQNTYVRPYRGGSDDNAADQVVQAGAPISLLVYLNGSLLTVTATQQTLSHTASSKVIKLTAAARSAGGAPVPAAALSWNWSFGDGRGSSAAAPTHTFAPGIYSVSVQVTDAATGSGGTATLRVAFAAPGTTGNRNQTGGAKPTKSKGPTGSGHGGHRPTNGSETGKKNTGSTSPVNRQGGTSATTTTQTTSTTQTTATQPTATTQTTATTTTTAATATTTTTTAATRRPRRLRTHHAARPTPAPAGTRVSGELISDVTTLPPGASPLVHLTPAAATPEAAVRQASHLSAAPAAGGALAAALLLVLGAGRELRGRRRWTLDDDGN